MLQSVELSKWSFLIPRHYYGILWTFTTQNYGNLQTPKLAPPSAAGMWLVMMLAIQNDQQEYIEAMYARQLMFVMYILGWTRVTSLQLVIHLVQFLRTHVYTRSVLPPSTRAIYVCNILVDIFIVFLFYLSMQVPSPSHVLRVDSNVANVCRAYRRKLLRPGTQRFARREGGSVTCGQSHVYLHLFIYIIDGAGIYR